MKIELKNKVIYDTDFYRIEGPGVSIKLTTKESNLLYELVKCKNETVNRSDILTKIWGGDDYFLSRTMDVTITKIRKKLAPLGEDVAIINVHGEGYKIILPEKYADDVTIREEHKRMKESIAEALKIIDGVMFDDEITALKLNEIEKVLRK